MFIIKKNLHKRKQKTAFDILLPYAPSYSYAEEISPYTHNEYKIMRYMRNAKETVTDTEIFS